MSKMISNIVFTKNRPLQLDAYFESLHRHLPVELIRTYLIYKPELFSDEYERLFRRLPDCVVVRERDFHSDFLRVLGLVDTRYILFGIDDVVYFDSVEFDLIDETFEHEHDIFGFAMRFGVDFLESGGDTVTEVPLGDRRVRRVNWKKARTPHSRYPFELCSTFYRTEFVKKIISSTMTDSGSARRFFSPASPVMKGLGKAFSMRSVFKKFGFFFSPNTLESWNCRWCRNHPAQMPDFTYFKRLCASAVQVNMVNTSTKNTFDGTDDHSVEALNEKYKKGYKLDIDFIAANKPGQPSCGQEHFRLSKS